MTASNLPAREHLEMLPEHPAPEIDQQAHRLRVDGAVEAPAAYSSADLAGVEQTDLVRDFECEEGWEVDGLHWRGVRLGALIDLARPAAGAAWAKLSADDFSITLPLAEARDALVALQLEDAPLSVSHGGPMRLLVRGGECFTSIKWLGRVEVTTEDAGGTAREIAMGRIGRASD
jgi:DMSO/TMAO reductase YedYZ molybdopterin-dependent catalytic subunit